MQRNPLFKKYRRKLIVEAFIKSLMIAADIAFGAAAVIAFSFWFSSVNGTWYAVGAMLVLLVGLTPVFYFLKYRPTDADIARRLDRLGLEERMITMTELEGDSSYLARRQAADAVKTLTSGAAFAKSALSIAISGVMAIPLAATAVLGGGMVTAGFLSEAGVIRSGNEVLDGIFNPDDEQYFTVRYIALGRELGFIEEGVGFIEGNDEQVVAYGGSATPVLALGDEEWYFTGWSDGWSEAYREDLEIVPDGVNSKLDEEGHLVVTYYAFFARLSEGDGEGDGDGDGDGEGDPQEGDQPSDAPDGDDQSDLQSDGSDPGEDGGEEGGGAYDANKDKIIDGDRDYHEAYDRYYEEAMEMLENGEDVPDYYKEIVKEYFGIII